jgi:hypothetical protein
MTKQGYQMINNFNMNLTQLEWIKTELKWISYEFIKFLHIILSLKPFSIFFFREILLS